MTTLEIPFDPARAERIAAARRTFPEQVVDRVAENLFRTDTVIDEVVADFATLGRGAGWRILDEALRTRDPNPPGSPDSLCELLTPLLHPPVWFDPERVRHGAELWWRYAPAVIVGMGGTLLTAYSFGDLNKPQAMNSRTEKMAARRYEETARWVLSATDPGTLIPGGTGFDSTLRIRFVHAMVRRHLRECGQWRTSDWGEPIHATGMAITIGGFLLMPLAMYEMFDMPLREDELESIRQLWCWIGYLMGVPDQLLPHSLADATVLESAAFRIFAPPDRDTEILTRALFRSGLRIERLLPQPLWSRTAPALRPVFSTLVWGGTGRIVTAYNDPDTDPPRNHPVVLTLRQIARGRELLRRRGRLGSDAEIAVRQRRKLSGVLDAMKAAPAPVDPRRAVTAAIAE
ncbi:oxygenase MpaB family protein [Nocardia sp. NBC_00511]|uniref:oxygenase MpaB family protein n=1 Tax=Nocardia sp. NBC_00511 TaxID=2903591 RepID=UPI0030E2F1A6